ncbi:MAG: AI-2E family transporter, partial [Actinomycetia bacterium]|nr:AI-2E family transporter [Actinomycetes bacterium]
MSAGPQPDPSLHTPAEDSVSPLVRKTAAWSWRLLVILGAIVALVWLFLQLEILFVPVALATILAALLMPVVDYMDRRGVPRGAAVALVLLSGISLVGALLAFVITQFIEGAPALVTQMTTSIEGAGTWLTDGPLDVSHQQINQARDAAI